ncbi:VapE domain-containing protein [Escherichia coli]|uniref:VapE domain-containing protein n=1 Tax=Escherichia coli TaxID=562 RepID=UPI003C6BE2E5
MKSFIPMSEDIFRLPYGRCNLSKPRQTVYIGTTNRDDFIHDETIATRFPVIKLT